MCIEDVLIGRATNGNFKYVSSDTDARQLVGQSALRRVLILFPHPSVDYVVRPRDDTSHSALFTVFTGNAPIVLNSELHGGIVRRPLFVTTAAAQTITVYEGYFDPVAFKG